MNLKSCTAVALALVALGSSEVAFASGPTNVQTTQVADASSRPEHKPVDANGRAIDENGVPVPVEELGAPEDADQMDFDLIPIGASTTDEVPLVDENGMAIDADGNAIALEDLPAPEATSTAGDSNAQAPLVDENGMAVDADGNAVAIENLPAGTGNPTTVIGWMEQMNWDFWSAE